MKTIYADYNASTPVHPKIKAQLPKLLETFGNPSSIHQLGQNAKAVIEKSRYQLAKTLNATPSQFTFTSSGTEANNQAIHSFFLTALKTKKIAHIITSQIEHPSILQTCRYWESLGMEVTYLPVKPNGLIDLDKLEQEIRENTVGISLIWANNETGVIQEIEKIQNIAQKHQLLFHTDATQALGKININLNELGVDLLTFSGHKIGCIKGVGGLFSKSDDHLYSFIHGGPQESEKRAGTENLLAIHSLKIVLENINIPDYQKHTLKIKNNFLKKIQNIPNIEINSPTHSLSNTINVSFLGVSADVLTMALDLKGIAVSTGSACATGSTEDSHVLSAMNLPKNQINSAIRFSFGIENTLDEIQNLSHILISTVQELRNK